MNSSKALDSDETKSQQKRKKRLIRIKTFNILVLMLSKERCIYIAK